ncbi:hypothetical protein HYE54_12030 [Aggregatibacter actinomycetemcomitans]|uniref:hypothetical protein n=1 Tax=Aggregatibacter actinomycetemcomitans TaxID=714 RepID=UPI00197C1BF8|nr:hypothetical protein [Aggregatibacter actinomycetemcomitans]MBN6069428.1 hypothetical protein [Aggregatibacter actinomycetemcomitans]MBN6087090.1 hypothetical protein [Aggregatibacter actinomycetemcomitans]
MNQINYFALLAVLSLMPVFLLICALFFAPDKYANKIFVYCLVACVLGGFMWVAVGVWFGLTALIGGA